MPACLNTVLLHPRPKSNPSVAAAGAAAVVDITLQCVDLKPDWAKGYSRLGAAYYGLQEWEQAIKAYEDGEGAAGSADLLCRD
jgi:predicted TPR repeat methyltransferase